MADTVRLVKALEPAADEALPSSVGGKPQVAAGSTWPQCRTHQVPMVLFFQLDAASAGAPLRAGEHLLVFQCPQWNDIPDLPTVKPGEALPARFWEQGEGHYAFFLDTGARTVLGLETHLVHSKMTFEDAAEDAKEVATKTPRPFTAGIRGFKIGGVPSWAQGPQVYKCGCGADLEFLVQVPLNFIFPKAPEAPQQPGTYSKKKYLIFLGNETYLFGCTGRCDPHAVFAVVQN
jgi:hypothetical protein